MTRSWYKVYGANTFASSKWRKTPFVVRGALLSLWTIASMQSEEGRWSSREELVEALELDGCPKPDEVVDRLIALRWIDAVGVEYVVHDWREWQEDMPEPKSGAQRTREWRERRRDGRDGRDDGASRSVTERHGDEGVTARDAVTIERGERENLEPSTHVEGKKREKPLDGQVRRWISDQGMAAPNGYVLNDLKALVKGYGPERVIAAMIESEGVTAKERVKGAERLLAPKNGHNGRADREFVPSKEEIHNAFE